MEKAVGLIQWARAFDRKVEAVRAEEERIEWAFKHTLKQVILDNEVDDYLKRYFFGWFFGQPAPVIPTLDGKR